ncbi:MAG: GNAT family N-acetyltransferase [Candidatus Omnitrophica bacterium]|nr:GNAT family N-acetyltransferase [Candidatus Omnitrophota bacterium]
MKNTKHKKSPAFVLGMSCTGLAAVRALSEAGDIQIFGFDCVADKPGLKTNTAECFVGPDVKDHPREFLAFLEKKRAVFSAKPVLIPTSDNFVEFLNDNEEYLRERYLFNTPSKDVLAQVVDKKGQYDLALAAGVPVPKTFYPRNQDDIDQIAREIQYPAFIKGLSTVYWRRHFATRKGIVVQDAPSLKEQLEYVMSLDGVEPIIQEIISGEDTDHYKICAYYGLDGEAKLSFTLQKIRQYPCHFGVGSCVESLWVPEVAELGHKFFKAIGYRGVGSIEFKKDRRDGIYKMIELNPRLWAQNGLAHRCGQNFPLTLYQDVTGEKVVPTDQFKEHVKWIAIKEDWASFRGYQDEGVYTWGTWIKSISTGKRCWSYFALKDPRPFLSDCGYGLAPFQKIFRFLAKDKQGSTVTETVKDTLRVVVIDRLDAFDGLEAQWNDCCESINDPNPFLRHGWLRSWWEGYGADKKLCILHILEDGKTLGFLPLMKYTTKVYGQQRRVVGFITNHWTRMNPIFAEKAEECAAACLAWLKKQKHLMIFSQMDVSKSQAQKFIEVLNNQEMPYVINEKNHSYISLKGSWEEYFASQSYNFRMDSRRKQRRLERKGSLKLIRSNGGVEAADLLKVEAIARASWQANERVNIIVSKEGKIFYETLVKKLGESHALDIAFLEVADKPVAYMIGLKRQGYYFAFDTAYDKGFHKLSPGVVMHNLLLEQLYNEGIHTFDFGYDAGYKKRWTEEIMAMKDVVVFPKGLYGLFLRSLESFKKGQSS